MVPSVLQPGVTRALEETVAFSERRHAVLAGNLANMDTPGYQARDLSVDDFQTSLKSMLAAQRAPARTASPGESEPRMAGLGAGGPLGSRTSHPGSARRVDSDCVSRREQRQFGNADHRNCEKSDAACDRHCASQVAVSSVADGDFRERQCVTESKGAGLCEMHVLNGSSAIRAKQCHTCMAPSVAWYRALRAG
jgi:flagellar basal body rod protein FlgB